MNVARRNLLQDRTRLVLSIAGVSLAVMLILLLTGFLTGMYQQLAAYLDRTPGSVVVAEEGVSNLLGANSLLRLGIVDATREIGEAAQATPILSQFVILDLHDKKQPAYLVGYDQALGGGPWRLAAGREPEADDEVVFDQVWRNGMG